MREVDIGIHKSKVANQEKGFCADNAEAKYVNVFKIELVTSEYMNIIKRLSVYLQKACKLGQECSYS